MLNSSVSNGTGQSRDIQGQTGTEHPVVPRRPGTEEFVLGFLLLPLYQDKILWPRTSRDKITIILANKIVIFFENCNFFLFFSFCLWPGTGQDRLSQSCPGLSCGNMSKSCPSLSCGKIFSLPCCPRTIREFLSLCPAFRDCPVLLETLLDSKSSPQYSI